MDDELLDVTDEGGAPLGVKTRAAVHRDGDWHAAFHLWVVSAEGVLLQRRSGAKSAWPGCLDATAAGHLVAGESVADGLREVEEELGVTYRFETLTALGIHRIDEQGGEGRRNRELQHVFAVRDDRPLDEWTSFDRAELEGLVLVGHDAFARLARGTGTAATARSFDGETVRIVSVRKGELVPSPYLSAIAFALACVGTGT